MKPHFRLSEITSVFLHLKSNNFSTLLFLFLRKPMINFLWEKYLSIIITQGILPHTNQNLDSGFLAYAQVLSIFSYVYKQPLSSFSFELNKTSVSCYQETSKPFFLKTRPCQTTCSFTFQRVSLQKIINNYTFLVCLYRESAIQVPEFVLTIETVTFEWSH